MLVQPRPIPYRPSISSNVEEPHSAVTFKTAQIRRNRRKPGDLIKAFPSQDATEEDKITLDLYCQDTKALASSSHRTLRRLSAVDSVLDFIITQREYLGLETEATKYPDGSEASNYRETVMATSAPVAGIKDLQLLSKRLAGAQKEPHRDIANEFVYALRRDVPGDSNPYDLHIVSSERARMHDSYYTVSAFNVAEVRASDLTGS